MIRGAVSTKLQTLLFTKQDVELDLSLDVQTQTHTTINIVPQFTVVCFRCLNIDGMGGGLALPLYSDPVSIPVLAEI